MLSVAYLLIRGDAQSLAGVEGGIAFAHAISKRVLTWKMKYLFAAAICILLASCSKSDPEPPTVTWSAQFTLDSESYSMERTERLDELGGGWAAFQIGLAAYRPMKIGFTSNTYHYPGRRLYKRRRQ
jgi:hypothetical protein